VNLVVIHVFELCTKTISQKVKDLSNCSDHRMTMGLYYCCLALLIVRSVISVSYISFCKPVSCDLLTSIHLGSLETRNSSVLSPISSQLLVDGHSKTKYGRCDSYQTYVINAKTGAGMNYSEFLNVSLTFATENRRSLCAFEHELITPIAKRHKNQLHYRSYDLLLASLLSHHLFLPSDQSSTSPSSTLSSVSSSFPGVWLEFGVYSGESINFTSLALQSRYNYPDPVDSSSKKFAIYGFDNFTGLPFNWGGMPKGYFSLNGELPPVKPYINLVKGLIEDSLPKFLAEEGDHYCQSLLTNSSVESRAALLSSSFKQRRNPQSSGNNNNTLNLLGMNIDTDLYSGSYKALELLYPCMKKGQLIHFHELFPNGNTPREELQSLFDFASKYSISLELLPYKSGLSEAAVAKVLYVPRKRIHFF
jgi:hypothetical protein